MHWKHGRHVVAILAALLLALPAAAAPPKRVVSTFLCTDEYVFRLLPRERIAALSFEAGDRHPVVSTIVDKVGGIPVVHNSAEEVLARNPDLVVMYAGTEPRLHAQLREAGIPIVDVPWANSLAEIRSITQTLGHALNADARARALVAEMDRELAQVAPADSARVRTLIYQPNGYSASDSVTDEILRDAGLVDVARTMGAARTGVIPVEMVVVSPPDLLLFDSANAARPSLASLMLHHPALKSLSTHTVFGRVPLTALSCPGPWSTSILESLAASRKRVLAQEQGRS